MNISSRSLFHFKDKFEYLQDIIEGGFKFRVCEEELPLSGYPNSIFDQLGILKYVHKPLIICFCDIPLSASNNHRSQYGEYAIAMSKEWGMMNKVTPIRYVHAHSPDFEDETYNKIMDLSHHLEQHNNDIFCLLTRVLTDMGGIEAPTAEDLAKQPQGVKNLLSMAKLEFNRVLFHWHKVMNYVRIYEGDWKDRVSGNVTHRIFYDEREWRAATENEGAKLPFMFRDVNHLIVNTEEERKILGEQIISHKEDLTVEDDTKVWSRIHIGEELHCDI